MGYAVEFCLRSFKLCIESLKTCEGPTDHFKQTSARPAPVSLYLPSGYNTQSITKYSEGKKLQVVPVLHLTTKP